MHSTIALLWRKILYNLYIQLANDIYMGTQCVPI